MVLTVKTDFQGKAMSNSRNIIISTISKGYTLYNHNFTFIFPIYTFPWRETKLFTRQIKVQIGKSTLIIIFIKENDAASGGK